MAINVLHIILSAVVGALYAWLLYRKGTFSRPVRWVLAVLRAVAVGTIVFLLFDPLFHHTSYQRQKPVVLLAQDVSQSVSLSADSSFSLSSLADEINGHCEVVYRTFGNDDYTDIAAALADPSLPEVQAVVLATDGIYNRGQNPASVAATLACPVHAVALGDTTPRRDAALANLRVNRIAVRGSQFIVELTVNATQLKGAAAMVSIQHGGRQLGSARVTYDEDHFSHTLSFSIPADSAGLQCYTAVLTLSDGEYTADNNKLSFYVDVIDNQRRVAILAAAPHPDLAALKAAVTSNPNYTADIFLATEGKEVKPDDYSLLLLHNLPAKNTNPQLTTLCKRLPTIYLIGAQTDLSRLNALHAGLEVKARSVKINEVTAIGNPQFSTFNLSDDDMKAVELFPPLSAPFGQVVVNNTQSLFTARIGNIDSRLPLIAVSTNTPQRSVFIWGEGLWRWRLADYQQNTSFTHFDHLISQLVTFAALTDNRSRLQVDADRRYPAGQPVTLHALYYNQAYELSTAADVRLSLARDAARAGADTASRFQFAAAGSSYSLRLPALAEGLYHYTATADSVTTSGSFVVEALHLEQQNLVADHALLRAMALASGGQCVSPDQTDDLKSLLTSLSDQIYTHRSQYPLRHFPLSLILILLLLSAEWILRKYHGTI